jgi:hypothetical protein
MMAIDFPFQTVTFEVGGRFKCRLVESFGTDGGTRWSQRC